MNPIQDAIIAAAKAPGGACVPDVAATLGVKSNTVDAWCRRMQRDGTLFQAKIAHRVVRWCDTKAKADAMVDHSKARAGLVRERAAATKAPADVKLDRSLPVVNPNNVQPTVIPCGYKPRFEGLVGSVTFGLQRGRVTR